jgi:hypothetical protein
MPEPIVLSLAVLIARDIFECGSMDNRSVRRIQFMSGSYADGEVGLGGLCEMALAEHIAKSIDKNLRLDMPEPKSALEEKTTT